MDDGATIAGYPLVRALRLESRREVWVAADASGAGVEVHRSLPGEAAGLAREVEALTAADHPHLLPIIDVATDGGAVLVRPLLARDLADWLVQRGSPPPGETVTALVPVAAALAALHEVGASVDGFVAGDVRLDADGTPLLTGEGARIETDRPTPAWREGSEGVAADVASWRQLAGALLESGGAVVPDAMARALDARDLAAAGEALLAAWPALPLALEPDAVQAARPAAAGRDRMRRRERAVGLDAVWARVALLAEHAAVGGGPILERILAAASSVRPRFWAIAGGGALALVLSAALLWPSGPADAQPGQADATAVATESSPSTDAVPVASEQPSPASPGTPPAGTAPPSAASPDAATPSAGAASATDPVAGAAALLAEREACLDAADAACLVLLHEPDSPQLAADRPWRMPDDGRLELVQRLGGAWLLRVISDDEPASVLVMSTEAGWTLRDAWSD